MDKAAAGSCFQLLEKMNKLILLLPVLLLLPLFVSAQACTEGSSRQCGISNVGECVYGTQTCSDSEWGICQGAKYPQSEICFDGRDNNCDGKIDENCECVSGSTRSCGISNIGICRLGKESCDNSTWGGCQGVVYPQVSELCNNNLDDNCNSKVDEGCADFTGTCFDKIKNQNETGIDCGGPCPSCGTCFDKVKNQNEIDIDCGGVCPSCATCFDRVQNQGETGIDCGGPCIACQTEKISNPEKELVQGNVSASNPEASKSKFSFLPVIIIILVLLLSALIYFYRISKPKETSENSSSQAKRLPQKITLKDSKTKVKKTKIEEELEKSFEKSKKLLRK